MKPTIGIIAHIGKSEKSILGQSSIGNTYVVSVAKAGGLPIVLPTIIADEDMDAYVNMCDGFLFSGGIDISPVYYGEEPHEKLGTTSCKLDHVQLTLMKKVIASGKPVLGICRGHQVLTVAAGGTLYQDVSEHNGTFVKHFQDTDYADASHYVTIEPDSILSSLYGKTLFTNSFHHQATKDLGPRLQAIAYAKDGIIEAVQLKDYKFGLGIQWHPEAMFAYDDESMRPIFYAFVQACNN